MAGHGDHSLGDTPPSKQHCDAATLTAYALGQLPAAKALAVRQHLAECAACRQAVAAEREFSRLVASELHRALDPAHPRSPLRFAPIAEQWRKPPRRALLRLRLKRLVSGLSFAPIIVLFILTITLPASSGEPPTLRALHISDDYAGPPALVALALDHAVVIVRLDAGGSSEVRTVRHISSAADLEFAPDSRWLAFREGGTLHLVGTGEDGSHVKLPLRGTGELAWSPDGAQLAYTDGGGQLLAFSLCTQTPTVLVPAAEAAWGKPVWSRDGAQIAYAVSELGGAGSQGIWRVDTATGVRVELARNLSPQSTLLAPEAWLEDGTLLVAWDAPASARGSQSALYRVDLTERRAVSLVAHSLAREDQLAWRVSAESRTVAGSHDRVATLQLASAQASAVPAQLPWSAAELAPGGAWLAAVVPEQPEGERVQLYSLEDERIVTVHLPGGASEKAAYWAGPEHLFVVCQPNDSSRAELWWVSVGGDHKPQRLVDNLPLSDTTGWRWGDVLAMRVISPAAPQSSQ